MPQVWVLSTPDVLIQETRELFRGLLDMGCRGIRLLIAVQGEVNETYD